MTPAPHAFAPPPRPVPPVPNVQLPPALDRAIAEISARQRALNGNPAPLRPPQPQPQPRQPMMAPPPPRPPLEPAPAPPAYVAPPPAAAAAPAVTPVPAQNLAGLEEQLRRITDQIETLRRPGVEEAIGALRAELKEIARALDDALPRRALDTIERQIQELSQRIAEGRQNGADSSALAGLEHGLAEVRDALRDLTPAENLVGFHDAVDALAHKIDLIVAQRDPATLHQLEFAITTLREMAAHVASDEALRNLAAQVEGLSEKIEQMAFAAPANDALVHLEQRIDALGRALAERAQNGTVVPPRLEALVQSLADKIEQIQQSRGDTTIATSHLEDRIVRLVERLDASDTRLNHLEAIERGLGDLLVNIQDMRAARDAEARRPQSQPAVEALQHDIARTQVAIDEVHGTLGLVVDRLASIEKDIRAESRRRTRGRRGHLRADPADRPPRGARGQRRSLDRAGRTGADAGARAQPAASVRGTAASHAPAPPMAAPAPPPVQAPVAAPRRAPPVNHGPIDPDLPPDQPLEPGSGPPRQRAGARIAASEAALGSARPAPPTGAKSSFIAAARRAAQTAVQEAGNRPPNAAETAPGEGGTPASRSGKMMSRMKALFVAASIAALAVGAVHVVGGVFGSKPDLTAMKAAKTLDRHPAPAADSASNLTVGAPYATQPPSAPLAQVPPAGNIAGILPPLDLGQSTYSVPSVLSPTPVTPPAVTPPPPHRRRPTTSPARSRYPRRSPSPPAARPMRRARPAGKPASGERPPIAIGGVKLRNAAAAGDAAAAYEVATRYAEGHGVPANITEAARWYERAAAKGLVPAQFRYASLLEKGQGVKKDLPAARRLYMAAAAKGNAKSMHNLAVLYAEGADGKPDYAAAAQWFTKAAQHGVADSQYNLGVLAARGLGMEKSLINSYKWFALAAAQGDKEAARKRDEVGGQLDPRSLAAAQHAVKTFVAIPQPHDATAVKAPPGGWDDPAGKSNAQGRARPAKPSAIGAYKVGKR